MRHEDDDEPTVEQLAAKMTKAEMLQILGSMMRSQSERMVRELLSVQSVYSEERLRSLSYLELCDVHDAILVNGSADNDDGYDWRPPDTYNIAATNPRMARVLGLKPRK